MDFFDEDDPADSGELDRPARRPRRGRGEAIAGGGEADDTPSRQQIRTRQLTLAGISIVVLILLFLAFRGCLDARKERAFKNYVSDLSALTAETKQLSDSFFGALDAGGGQDGDISLESEVNGNRGTAQSLYDRAQGLDAPDEISGAQAQVVLAYDLRRDALDSIANQLPAALGNKGANKAINSIAEQMKVFLASDVLYDRARFEIEQALENEEIVVDDGVPESEFLPTGNNDPDYLSSDEIGSLLSGAGGSSSGGGAGANCDPGDDLTHGLGLVSTTAQPIGTVLQPGATTTLAADSVEFEVAVQNQGDADESGIKVSLGGDFSGTQTINSITAGETQSVTIVPKPSPSAGETGSLEVTVDTVCGEQVAENNSSEAPYELTFE